MVAHILSAVIVLLCGADQDPTTLARELYRDGENDYSNHDYDAAIDKFLKAYELSKMRGLLFDVAQAYRLEGRCDAALRYYLQYIGDDGAEVPNRAEVAERIIEMERCVRTAPAERSVQTSSSAGGRLEPPPLDLEAQPLTAGALSSAAVPISILGTGLVLGVAGGVVNWRAHAKFDAVEASCPCAHGRFDGWAVATNLSIAMIAIGIAAIATGAIWWIGAGAEPL